MIKAVGHKDGKPYLLVGITDDNVAALVDDKPLKIDLSEVGLGDLEIAIFHGKTEADLIRAVGPLVGPETTVRDEV